MNAYREREEGEAMDFARKQQQITDHKKEQERLRAKELERRKEQERRRREAVIFGFLSVFSTIASRISGHILSQGDCPYN